MTNSGKFAAVSLLLLCGCAAGPDYHRPAAAVPAAYKEAQGWKAAEPGDNAQRGNWWEMYGDPELNALVPQVAISNQNVRAAEAQYRQAEALLDAARAGFYPTLSASSSYAHGELAAGAPAAKAVQVGAGASWVPDLWGSIRRTVESNDASVQASSAALQGALLSAQSVLVQSYMQLRVNDAQRVLLEKTIKAYARSLDITRNRYESGVAARVDVAQAETQLKLAEAQMIDLGVARTQLEHAIAVLIGKPPAEFAIKPSGAVPGLPEIPVGVPSELLERRPDIAEAERNMAAANALIGVAHAAFFPTLTLNASGAYQGASVYNLMSLPNQVWSVGPSLALTLFDGGARSAAENKAVAVYDQNVATYRQTVLGAFQEVEDNLSALSILNNEEAAQKSAEQLAEEALQITDNQYQSGTVSYLNVVTAETTALSSSIARLNIESRRLVASAVLLTALGGGWRAPQ